MLSVCAEVTEVYVTMSCLPIVSDRAATEGSKYSELGRQPHKCFNSKYLFLVCSAAYTGYSDCNVDCMEVHGAGGGGGGGGCTGGCCPCSTSTYTGATFCNLYCVVFSYYVLPHYTGYTDPDCNLDYVVDGVVMAGGGGGGSGGGCLPATSGTTLHALVVIL